MVSAGAAATSVRTDWAWTAVGVANLLLPVSASFRSIRFSVHSVSVVTASSHGEEQPLGLAITGRERIERTKRNGTELEVDGIVAPSGLGQLLGRECRELQQILRFAQDDRGEQQPVVPFNSVSTVQSVSIVAVSSHAEHPL